MKACQGKHGTPEWVDGRHNWHFFNGGFSVICKRCDRIMHGRRTSGYYSRCTTLLTHPSFCSAKLKSCWTPSIASSSSCQRSSSRCQHRYVPLEYDSNCSLNNHACLWLDALLHQGPFQEPLSFKQSGGATQQNNQRSDRTAIHSSNLLVHPGPVG